MTDSFTTTASTRPSLSSFARPRPAIGVRWSLVAGLFFVASVATMVAGFFGGAISFTLAFFPLLVAILVGGHARPFLLPSSPVWRTVPERTMASLSLLLCACAVMTWSLAGLTSTIPLEVRAFNLVVPVGILLAQAALWTSAFDENEVQRTARLFCAFAVLNGLASAGILLIVNVLQLVPTAVFYANPEYSVILFRLGGRGWLRTPGLFGSGGVNGTFLLLTTAATLFFLASQRPRRCLLWQLLLSAQVFLVFATLTRRSMLGLVTVFAVAGIWGAKQDRKVVTALAGSWLAMLVLTLLVWQVPDIAASHSLTERLDLWAFNLGELFADHPLRLLFGFGLIQSSLNHLAASPIRMPDNGYLELLLYGGLLLPFLFLIHTLALLALNISLGSRGSAEWRWLARANSSIIAAMLVVSLFGPFVFNAPEAIPTLLGLGLSTRFVLRRTRAAAMAVVA